MTTTNQPTNDAHDRPDDAFIAERALRTASLVGGARFKVVDELLRHLDELHQAFVADPALRPLALLIHRSHADLETATEATLSGHVAVASDAMRDVVEIENLLLDFAVNPAHIDEWLVADRRTLVNKFGPAKIRDRLHAAGEGRYAETAESMDYRAHSAALHVSPYRHPVAARGFSTDQAWGGDAGFWEIFQHMRRLRRAIQRLTGVLAHGAAVDQVAGQKLANVEDAFRRTQERCRRSTSRSWRRPQRLKSRMAKARELSGVTRHGLDTDHWRP